MKVTHFVAEWLPPSEGFVFDMITHLPCSSSVVCAHGPVNLDRFPFEDLYSLAPVERFVRPVCARPLATALLFQRRLRLSCVSVIHAHHGYQVELPLGAARRSRLPLVISLHGHDVTGWLDARPAYYEEAAAFVNDCDNRSAVVVPSTFLAGVAGNAGFESSRISVIPTGVDTSFWRPSPLPPGPPEALFVGRFVPKKGLDVLAQAWRAVSAKLPEARLSVLGYGPLEDLARSIPGNVRVEIAPTRARVRYAMRRASAVVSPSHTAGDDAVESLLIVNLEAQASGRAVVTTDHGAIPEYVLGGTTALVVPQGEPAPLADALVAVLGDPERAARMGSAGPDWAARFDVGAMALRMAALYGELVTCSARSGEPVCAGAAPSL